VKNHWLYEWDDETSASDPKGEWQGGSEYYKRHFKIWVPNRIRKDDFDRINEYIDDNLGVDGKWVD
jgi:hypothetical protein